jgi:thymidylate kinase
VRATTQASPADGVTPTRASSIVIVGPDGAGKSALTEALIERLGADRTLHLHGRAPVLPRQTPTDRPVLEPHKDAPYPGFIGFLKLVYLFFDTQLTWRTVVPRALRDGRTVVVERGWWDLLVDPRRYRLEDARMARRFTRWIPGPDLHVLLSAPSEVLYERKPELSIAELDRQQARWQRELPEAAGVLRLDARRPIPELVDEIVGAAESRGQPAQAWVALPPGAGRTRWWIPRGNGRQASRALAIHHPVSRPAIVGWMVGRLIARMGLLRLLPAVSAPPLLDLLPRIAPSGGSAAIATSWRGGRGRILILDDQDQPSVLVKVADDPLGRAELAHEGEMAETLGPALTAPLRTPQVLARGPGYVGFAAVDWSWRWSAWELPEDVAASIGRLYRAGAARPGAPGYAHGDFTPWNLLRTPTDWTLIDWEHARTDARPFHDLFHFYLQSVTLLGQPTMDDFVAALDGAGPVGPAFRAYATAAGVPLAGARDELIAYLQAWLAGPEVAESEPEERATRERLLARLGSDRQ